MDARLQRRVQRYGWDKASSSYERYWAQQLQPAQSLLLELAQLETGERVIDVACGTGLVTLPAARAVGASGEVVATDLSQKMIDRLEQEIEAAGLEQVTLRRMDAEQLDFDDGAFDAAICALGLMYLPAPVEGLAQMRRVLRSGGRAVAAVWGAREKCGWSEIFPIVDARVSSEVCPMFFHLGTGEGMRLHFEAVGFDDIESVRIETVLEYETAEQALRAAFAGGPVAMAYSRFDAATREAAHREYLESIEPYRIDSTYRIPGEFVITRGIVAG